MKGDFTRNTFDPSKHFSRVLMQQGRVQLDADWNEQAAILLRYLQSLAVDLMGPHAGPPGAVGFKIGQKDGGWEDFEIGPGHYYVQGILCENEPKWGDDGKEIPVTYYAQPDYPDLPDLPPQPFLVYLDVWERHLTYIEDPEIHEVALVGPDTASRAKIVWQVRVEPEIDACPPDDAAWSDLVERWQPQNRGMLRAGTEEFEVDESTAPCTIVPESKYRGAENQLYRVEIHTSGTNGPEGKATFKWSRENGSVVFPIRELSGGQATLENLGRDERFSLSEGDWVEVVDDRFALRGEVLPLVQVAEIDRDRRIVTLKVPEDVNLPDYDENSAYHPLLRRWDHKELDSTQGYPRLATDDGALVLEEDNWLLLEDGIQVYFAPAPAGESHTYRSGDYWLIPARTATGDVEWPGPEDAPELRPPHGVQHAYAPLAVVSAGAMTDCRREIDKIWTSPSPSSS